MPINFFFPTLPFLCYTISLVRLFLFHFLYISVQFYSAILQKLERGFWPEFKSCVCHFFIFYQKKASNHQKITENAFLFHLKRSFGSGDVQIFKYNFLLFVQRFNI